MKRLAILCALVALSACTNAPTATQCEQATTGLNTVAELTDMFVRLGGSPVTARKLADAVVAGRMLRDVACAQVGTTAPTTPVQPVL